MKKTILAKIAAVCGTAMLSLTGLSAFAQTDRAIEERRDIVEGKTNIAAGIVQADDGERIKFPVYMVNNVPDGFTSLRVQLTYDQRLTAELDEEDTPVYKIGEAANDVSCKFTHDAESHTITMTAAGKTPEKDNGVLFTVEMSLPPYYGGRFPVTVKVDQFLDAKNQPIASEAVNGYINVTGSPLLGDVNLDKVVSVDDAQITLMAYTNRIAGKSMNLKDKQIKAADIDGNNEVSVEDAQLILLYYTQKTVAGKDVSWDDLLPKKE